MLIVCCDYHYEPQYKLTSIRDGQNMERIACKASVQDITFMRDDLPCNNPLFPSTANLLKQLEDIGQRTKPEDYFVFFYAGHADSIDTARLQQFATHNLMPEEDGKDEVFQLPGPAGQFDWKYFLIDDDFATAVNESFDSDVHVLIITDCCHSGTIADVDSYDWGDRPIVSFSACRDFEEATDTGRGGVLTKGIEKAVRELGFVKGREEYSINAVWKRIEKYVAAVEKDQHPRMCADNCDTQYSAWPLPQAWWANLPGTSKFKIQQEIEAMRRDNMNPDEGMDCYDEGVEAMKRWEAAFDEDLALRGSKLSPPPLYEQQPQTRGHTLLPPPLPTEQVKRQFVLPPAPMIYAPIARC